MVTLKWKKPYKLIVYKAILTCFVVPGGQISNWVVLWFRELYEKVGKNLEEIKGGVSAFETPPLRMKYKN